jgi:hypothetical protein
VLSNAAAVASPALTPEMRSIYTTLAVLQFEVRLLACVSWLYCSLHVITTSCMLLLQGILLPPACTGSYAFEAEVSFIFKLCTHMTPRMESNMSKRINVVYRTHM